MVGAPCRGSASMRQDAGIALVPSRFQGPDAQQRIPAGQMKGFLFRDAVKPFGRPDKELAVIRRRRSGETFACVAELVAAHEFELVAKFNHDHLARAQKRKQMSASGNR